AFFIRRDGAQGEAGYDRFKTKAANLSALEQARNSAAFCADAHALYAAAFAHRGSLMRFVESRTADIGNICVESRPALLAKTDMRPQQAPETARTQTRLADVGGVPTHSLPAMPFRSNAAVPPPRDLPDEEADGPSYADEETLPPPRPRIYDIRSRGYGPPPGWRDYSAPPPRYGWYPRDAYSH
ncbi:MAG TPA: hypothetical protein VJS85_00325, partial [Rhizomicrobium sp.]|nr:hypothetical protein [Rhizomicrobium sp.]